MSKNNQMNAVKALESMLEVFGGQFDDDGNEGYWVDGLFYQFSA